MKMKLSLTKSITGFAAISAILITAACANHSHDDGTGHMSAGDGQHDHHKMMQEKHMGDTGGHGHMSVDMKDGMQDGQKGGGHHGGGAPWWRSRWSSWRVIGG
ncbi:hypothetical protein A3755_04435 [Oleiphilus sp. HI0085]|nr:hypothetical protein A3755_04435 [Oleiphilus sp. HI0085]